MSLKAVLAAASFSGLRRLNRECCGGPCVSMWWTIPCLGALGSITCSSGLNTSQYCSFRATYEEVLLALLLHAVLDVTHDEIFPMMRVDRAGLGMLRAEDGMTARPAISTTSRWCTKKSAPKRGWVTDARRKFHSYFWPAMVIVLRVLPNVWMGCPPAEVRLTGSESGRVRCCWLAGNSEQQAPVSTRYLSPLSVSKMCSALAGRLTTEVTATAGRRCWRFLMGRISCNLADTGEHGFGKSYGTNSIHLRSCHLWVCSCGRAVSPALAGLP